MHTGRLVFWVKAATDVHVTLKEQKGSTEPGAEGIEVVIGGFNFAVISILLIFVLCCEPNTLSVIFNSYGCNFNFQWFIHSGWANTASVLRCKHLQGSNADETFGPVLNKNKYLAFWLTWTEGGDVAVGKGTTVGENQFLTGSCADRSIDYIGISTGFGFQGKWVIPYGKEYIWNMIVFKTIFASLQRIFAQNISPCQLVMPWQLWNALISLSFRIT